jgi:hypothetical protein
MYAGSNSTIYSSSDSGATWALAASTACFAYRISIDPITPTTLYVTSGYCTAGPLKSTDGGLTWTTLSGFPSGTLVFNIAIDPKSPNTLYAASSLGISGSTDGGQTWTLLYSSSASSVVIDPQQPATIYAVISGQVYVSTNSGVSWAPTGSGLTGSVNSLAISSSNPAILYAVTNSGVFATSTSGASWSPAGLAQDTIESLTVDPNKANILYTTAAVYSDGFVAKINPTGQKLIYSTYLGGSGNDEAVSVALNAVGDAFVTGRVNSPDFPSTAGAFQPANGSNRATAFVTRISGKTPACTYAVSPGSYVFYANAGQTANFSVVAPSACAWTATTSDSWIMIESNGGPGAGPLAIGVTPNSGATRTGTITVGNASIAIMQPASSCGYSLSPNSIAFPQAGGPASVSVSAGTGCDWIVANLPAGITVTSGGSGSGNGTVHLQAAPNPFPSERYFFYGPIIGGYILNLSQAGTSGDAVGQPATPGQP